MGFFWPVDHPIPTPALPLKGRGKGRPDADTYLDIFPAIPLMGRENGRASLAMTSHPPVAYRLHPHDAYPVKRGSRIGLALLSSVNWLYFVQHIEHYE
jgi:hypothetical protein